ncbi:hypothetical protein DL93DRAFT_2122703, partial [Clavulina sp. PMI_390]
MTCVKLIPSNANSPAFSLPFYWNLSPGGWLKGPKGELILWIPSGYRAALHDQRLDHVLGWGEKSLVKLS